MRDTWTRVGTKKLNKNTIWKTTKQKQGSEQLWFHHGVYLLYIFSAHNITLIIMFAWEHETHPPLLLTLYNYPPECHNSYFWCCQIDAVNLYDFRILRGLKSSCGWLRNIALMKTFMVSILFCSLCLDIMVTSCSSKAIFLIAIHITHVLRISTMTKIQKNANANWSNVYRAAQG